MWFFIKKLFPYRWQLLLGLLLTVTFTAASIALLSLSGWFIAASAFAGLSLTTAAVFNYMIPAGVIRFLALLRIASRYGERVINHDVTFKILTRLRVWFYTRLIPLAPAHLTHARSGDLLNRAIHDIDTLDHLYLRVVSPCLVASLTTLGVSIFIAFYSHTLAWCVLGPSLLALTIMPIVVLIHSKKIGYHLAQTLSDLRTETIDCIQGIIPLLFYLPKQQRLAIVTRTLHDLVAAEEKMAHLKGLTMAGMTLLSGLTIGLVLWFGIPQVNQLQINGAQLAMILLGVIVAFEQLLNLPMAFLSMGKTTFATQRLLDIANQPPTVVFPKTAILEKLSDADITLQNVTFSYPNRTTPALRNIQFDVPLGTKIAITGPSGSGKTTLMHLMTRTFDPTSGNILLNNRPLSQFSEEQLRTLIAVVPQRIHIFNSSIHDNLTFWDNHISTETLHHVLKTVDLTNLISELPNGLNTPMGDFGKQFSGGQIRRIGIARALLSQAPIQIWDEPTTGINRELFEKLWRQCMPFFRHRTLIVMTHDEFLLQKVDRRLHLEDGVVQEVGDIITV